MTAMGSSALLAVGGLVALAAGLGLAGATQGQAGLTLVLGGALLVISAIGVAVDPGPTAV